MIFALGRYAGICCWYPIALVTAFKPQIRELIIRAAQKR